MSSWKNISIKIHQKWKWKRKKQSKKIKKAQKNEKSTKKPASKRKNIILGQYKEMKPGKPKKKIIELLKKHFDNMLSELEMEEKKTNHPKKRKLVGQVAVLP